VKLKIPKQSEFVKNLICIVIFLQVPFLLVLSLTHLSTISSVSLLPCFLSLLFFLLFKLILI